MICLCIPYTNCCFVNIKWKLSSKAAVPITQAALWKLWMEMASQAGLALSHILSLSHSVFFTLEFLHNAVMNAGELLGFSCLIHPICPIRLSALLEVADNLPIAPSGKKSAVCFKRRSWVCDLNERSWLWNKMCTVFVKDHLVFNKERIFCISLKSWKKLNKFGVETYISWIVFK